MSYFMQFTREQTRQAAELIDKASRIRVLCHKSPDGDALGSLLGLGMLLELAYPDKTVTFHCFDPVPDTFGYLPNAARVQPAFLPTGSAEKGDALHASDLIMFVDIADPKLTGMLQSHPELFDGSQPSIMFDHHPGNPKFGKVNFLVPEAASTCEIVVQFAKEMQWKMTPDIATALLTGVYTDTGGLLHSNTSSAVYRTVADLLRAGARRQAIVTAVFRTAKLSTLRLWGRVLEKISITDEGGAVAAVTEGDFRATGADYSELTGAIDYVNAVPGMRFSLVLSERGGQVKGSLRTLRDDVDVSQMAGKFQGGGHRKAAGFSVDGKLKPEIRWKVIEQQKPTDQSSQPA